MSAQVPFFTTLFAVAAVFFLWSCYLRFSLVLLGKPDDRFSDLGRRFANMLLYAFGQKRVVTRSYPFGLNHSVFFWCFLVLMIANIEFLLHGLFPGYIALSRLPEGLYFTLALILDIVSLVALLAVIVAISRRLFFPPKYIDARTVDAFVVLGLVAALMIAYFGMHGSEIALGSESAAAFMPVSNFVGSFMLAGVSENILAVLVQVFFWIHAVALLLFLDYLPYSKHMHILTSIPNCFFRSIDKINTQTPEEFKKGNSYGVGQVDQFRWKDLFDSMSCTECGRCNDSCPATLTGKALNPRVLIHDIKMNLLHNGKLLKKGMSPDLPLIGGLQEGSIAEDALWACTTCGACMEVCPVFIEHVPKIVYMRRHQVEMRAKFPDELLTLFDNMENRSNPWGIIPAERGRWTAETVVPLFDNEKTEYLFYVGCAGAFDTRNKHNTLSIAGILNKAGVSWGALGKDEQCCGDSLRRLGNEFVFAQMARQNVKTFKEMGVRKVITQCPHCYNTLKNDYRQFGGELEVLHYTELMLQLVRSGKLAFKSRAEVGKVVFHDSCYLGRYNSIYRAPRELIELATGHTPLEMERAFERSFCCGAGGGRMWMEESAGNRVNLSRVNEALKKQPDAICVCCPYCVTMMEDGLMDLKVSEQVKVLELSEIIEKALQ
jgi:Fe-S oxidoreductase/nitrate reductase gamma subunit